MNYLQDVMAFLDDYRMLEMARRNLRWSAVNENDHGLDQCAKSLGYWLGDSPTNVTMTRIIDTNNGEEI